MIDNKTKFNIVVEAKQPNVNISAIARKYNISPSNVYQYRKYFEPEYGDNEYLRDQILLGSKLGDGYFQQTRTNVYKYRESHSIKEKEYAQWKYLMMADYTDNMSIISKNNGQAVEIYTNASSSDNIKPYYEMSVEDVLQRIDIVGLLVYLLDDGWYSTHSTMGNIIVGSKILTTSEKLAIMQIFKRYNIESTLVGKKQDICITSSNNFILLAYLHKMMFTMDLDIIHKKFGKIRNQI